MREENEEFEVVYSGIDAIKGVTDPMMIDGQLCGIDSFEEIEEFVFKVNWFVYDERLTKFHEERISWVNRPLIDPIPTEEEEREVSEITRQFEEGLITTMEFLCKLEDVLHRVRRHK
jgi:hypothetical protein